MPRPDVRDERVPQILDAATRVFSGHGIDGASMSQIASTADVSKATIYHYFASKDELVLALVERLFAADRDSIARLSTDRELGAARFLRYAEELSQLLSVERGLASVFAEIKARTIRVPRIRPAVTRHFARYRDACATAIAQGIEDGWVEPTSDVDRAAEVFIVTIEGAIIMSEFSQENLSSLMVAAVEHFVRSIAP